jgi:hypothetical protein
MRRFLDQEIDDLEAFLGSDATPHECMSITALDGFLTALATARVSRFRAVGCQSSGVAGVTRSSSRLNRRTES